MILPALPDPPPFAMRKLWEFETPSHGVVASSGDVVAMGDRLFFAETGGFSGGAYGCLDAGRGRLLWRKAGAEDRTGTILAQNGRVVVRIEGEVREVDPADGRTIWTTPVEAHRLGPLLIGDRMVVETAAGRLEAFDLRTHARSWRLDYGSEFRGNDRSGTFAVVGDSLLAAAADGKIVRVDLATGLVKWARAFDGDEAWRIVPMGERVAIYGRAGMAAWRTSDGATLWRKPGNALNGGFYAARQDELWRFEDYGRSLLRWRAGDGKRVGRATGLAFGSGLASSPTAYGGGYALPSQEGLLRLDAAGGAMGVLRLLDHPYGLLPLKDDLVAWHDGLIYRLTPGTTPVPPDAARQARRIVGHVTLSDGDRRALWDLGREAIPALAEAIPGAEGRRRDRLASILTRIARAEDTEAMLELAEREGTFGPPKTEWRDDLAEWFEWRADGDLLARHLLPRLRAATEEAETLRLLRYMTRSTDASVVEELFRRLRSPEASRETKGLIFPAIAASGRRDVLEWILKGRAGARRLATPTPGLSTVRDADGDRIPDAFDANPDVAPRPLDETERVLVAAFEAFAKADYQGQASTSFGYASGMRPFELLGWPKALRVARPGIDLGSVMGGVTLSFERFSSDGDVVRFGPRANEATVRVARRIGYGTEIRLRRFGGEWFSTSLKVTWQN